MKRWEHEAIRLRYNGKTYREIAGELSRLYGMTIVESSIRGLFMVDGRLYLDYLEYETKQNDYTDETSRQQYKQMAAWVPKAEKQLYKEALKKEDYRLAWDILKNINDRAGVVVVRKTEVTTDDKTTKRIDSFEQFLEVLKRTGIDSRTGLRVGNAEMEKN